MINARDTLNRSAQQAKALFRAVGKIKAKLQHLQDHTEVGKEEIEKRKDMWAELHTRLYKELYLINRVVLPGLYSLGCPSTEELPVVYDDVDLPDIHDVTTMRALYSRLVTLTNKRVFKLRDEATRIATTSEFPPLRKGMEDAIALFNQQVLPCVADNLYHQALHVGIETDKGTIHRSIQQVNSHKDEALRV